MNPALDELVDAVASGSVELADGMLRASGAVSPPTVHMLMKHLRQPYLGSIATPPFRRGPHAASAIAALGLLPSVVLATRLVVVWEYSDLCAALDLPGWRNGRNPQGLVVLDADLGEHVVRWHPFQLRVDGVETVPAWGPTARHPAGALPGPIDELLAVWRELHRRDIGVTRAEMEAAGYVVTWASELAGA